MCERERERERVREREERENGGSINAIKMYVMCQSDFIPMQ